MSWGRYRTIHVVHPGMLGLEGVDAGLVWRTWCAFFIPPSAASPPNCRSCLTLASWERRRPFDIRDDGYYYDDEEDDAPSRAARGVNAPTTPATGASAPRRSPWRCGNGSFRAGRGEARAPVPVARVEPVRRVQQRLPDAHRRTADEVYLRSGSRSGRNDCVTSRSMTRVETREHS